MRLSSWTRPRRDRSEQDLCTFYSKHLFCKVWCPAEQCPFESDTPLNNVLGGYQTPQNKVLQGIKPRRTTFKYEHFHKFETDFKNILGCEFGDYIGLIRGKNQK